MRPLLSRIVTVLLFSVSVLYTAHAQSYSDEARRQGYEHLQDTTYFIFDVSRYGVAPERVAVTGAFRGWDQDMDAPEWLLAQASLQPDLWVLAVSNPGYTVISPATPFKFRIDMGEWLEPHDEAPNAEGGNLVFMYGVVPPRLRAELAGIRSIWADISGEDVDRPLNPSGYLLTDARGNEIPIERVLPNTASKTLVVPALDLDMRRVYYLEVPEYNLRARCRFDGWFRTLYSDKPLGAIIKDDDSQTTFRIFSPRADRVVLYLYEGAEDTPDRALRQIEMIRDDVGVWEAAVGGNLHGTYYDFTVHGPPDPGNSFYETDPVHISDPYALVNVDAWGKSRVWRPGMPATPLPSGRPKMEDVIAYEVHIQDFTDRLPVSEDLKGTIPAMAMPGLSNSRGEPVGLDYLVDLGINVVHLLPVQEYLHYPDDEWRAAFAEDPFMQEQGISEENYQWGYRTTHAFAVESRFRRRGTEHGAQREQFRDMVQAFHDRGIAVIIDLVPNHTGENMDGRQHLLNFNVLDKPYYYRTDEDVNHIGPFGNEVKAEERPMVQRWIIDQCKHWIDTFGIDGFRIDLAGQIDKQTLIALRRELGDDIIIYGEPWIPPSDPDVASHEDWGWYKADAPITYFQDDARNVFGSPVGTPRSKLLDRGYPGGDATQRTRVMLGLTNGWPEEGDPNRGINYLDIHDDWALADRFATEEWDGRLGIDKTRFKIAATLLFTSLGPIVLHGGTEMIRSKGAAPLVELVKEIPSGTLYFHGKRDTYNLRRANQFEWENVGESEGPNDYAAMHAFWKGLIALRNSEIGEVFRLGEAPPAGYYEWIVPEDEHLLGYIVDDRVFVLINVDKEAAAFENVVLPAGDWRQVADGERMDLDGLRYLEGGKVQDFLVPGPGLQVWVRE